VLEKQEILDAIRRSAEENDNRPLGRNRFERETGISESDWAGRYWIRWSDAVREAGFEPNELQRRTHDVDILDSLIDLISKLEHFPVENELRLERRANADFPSHGTIQRLGKKAVRARLILERCRERGDVPHIAAICAPLAAQPLVQGDSSESDPDQKAKLVHKIQTDDSVGIERYWHRRFENKRLNGEWFHLTADDVRAFKRRKRFM